MKAIDVSFQMSPTGAEELCVILSDLTEEEWITGNDYVLIRRVLDAINRAASVRREADRIAEEAIILIEETRPVPTTQTIKEKRS
jgi:hypothetical protein